MTADPIELEVIKSRLEEAALTMEIQLFHSGYSPILRESGDGSACITDANGGVVIGMGVPLHLFPYQRTVRAVIERQGDRMRPGDAFIINDPYVGGNFHVPDTAIVTPFFHQGRLGGFCASIAHKPDIGGIVVGSSSPLAREIYHDGLLFPGLRFWTDQGPDPDMEALLRANTRAPDEVVGDFRAQVGCTRLGCARLSELFDEYGADRMTSAFEELIQASERRIRQKLMEMPDGTGEAEAYLDHDTVDVTRPIGIRVRVTKTGGRIVFDYSGSDPETTGPVSLRPQSTETAAGIALITMLDPDIPLNDGCRRAVEIVNPPGLITHATRPRPVNNYPSGLFLANCVAQKAMSMFMPERAVAPPGFGAGNIQIGYGQPGDGKRRVQYELVVPSLGGTPTNDGALMVVPLSHHTPSQPIEIVETEYPVEVTRFELIPDSAGAGRFRGGPGWRREYRFFEPATMTVRMGHFEHGSWGVNGGGAPNRASCTVTRQGEPPEALPIMATRELAAGDLLTIEMAGGGGFDDPSTRRPELVVRDVAGGVVSATAARDVYRVALGPDFEVDVEATRALRS